MTSPGGSGHAAGYSTRLQEEPYRFQRDARQMLVILPATHEPSRQRAMRNTPL